MKLPRVTTPQATLPEVGEQGDTVCHVKLHIERQRTAVDEAVPVMERGAVMQYLFAPVHRFISGKSRSPCIDEHDFTGIGEYLEGFMDFLSAATLGLETGDCLVLNSISNVEKAMRYLDGYGRIDCYLDRDEAGRRTLEMLKGHYEERVCDRSALYDGCKDLNEYLQLTTKKEQ